MDIWSEEKRSEVMSRIRSKNTKPELALRSAIHSLGYRFRLHKKELPGKPDLAFPRYHVAVFVHGCFWHQHKGCIDGKIPKSRQDYWIPKFRRTADRDKAARKALRHAGWTPLVVWECEVEKDLDGALDRLTSLLKEQA
jgi:DNA mismatch endonuclease (patch repair protein)